MFDDAPEPPIETDLRLIHNEIADTGFDDPTPAETGAIPFPREHRAHARADCPNCMEGRAHPLSRCGTIGSRAADDVGPAMSTADRVAALEAAGLRTIAVIPANHTDTTGDAA